MRLCVYVYAFMRVCIYDTYKELGDGSLRKCYVLYFQSVWRCGTIYFNLT